ncbi:hypothetical protein ACFLV4_07200 [Chloroflexota bacterium]
MIKRFISLTMVLSMIFIVGCAELEGITEGLGSTSSAKSLEIIRDAKLGTDWQMNQMKVKLGADEEVSIVLKLANGDKVDSYFYLEKGEHVDFEITGATLIYEPKARKIDDSAGITSDRFSFIAEQTQGNTYTLTFRNPADDEQAKVTVILEVIYPVKGSLFVPIEKN